MKLKRIKFKDLEMVSEHLKEEITYLKEEIKQTIPDKEKRYFVSNFVTLYKFT